MMITDSGQLKPHAIEDAVLVIFCHLPGIPTLVDPLPDTEINRSLLLIGRQRPVFLQQRRLLRRFLGQILNYPSDQLVFEIGPKGKPAVASNVPSIEFNISHSQDWFSLALSRHPVGLDLETISDQARPWMKLARRFFTTPETDWLSQQPQQNLAREFLHLWTQKESILKLTGDGLSQHMNAVDLCLLQHQLGKQNITTEFGLLQHQCYFSVSQYETENELNPIHYFLVQPDLEICPIKPPYIHHHFQTLRPL